MNSNNNNNRFIVPIVIIIITAFTLLSIANITHSLVSIPQPALAFHIQTRDRIISGLQGTVQSVDKSLNATQQALQNRNIPEAFFDLKLAQQQLSTLKNANTTFFAMATQLVQSAIFASSSPASSSVSSSFGPSSTTPSSSRGVSLPPAASSSLAPLQGTVQSVDKSLNTTQQALQNRNIQEALSNLKLAQQQLSTLKNANATFFAIATQLVQSAIFASSSPVSSSISSSFGPSSTTPSSSRGVSLPPAASSSLAPLQGTVQSVDKSLNTTQQALQNRNIQEALSNLKLAQQQLSTLKN